MSIPRLNIPDKWKSYYSEYPNGYSLLEAIIEWTDKVNIMIDDLNLTKEQVDKLFSDTLPENVERVLNEWYADGMLADLINIDLMNTKADQTEVDEISSQLVDLMNTKADQTEVDKKADQTEVDKKADQTEVDEISSQLVDIAINVKTFGAVGDGVTDDTFAFQRAINEKKPLKIPTGEYLITNSLEVYKNTTIFGSKSKSNNYGESLVKLKFIPSVKKDLFITKETVLDPNNNPYIYGISIGGFSVTGVNGRYVFNLPKMSNLHLYDISQYDGFDYGILVDGWIDSNVDRCSFQGTVMSAINVIITGFLSTTVTFRKCYFSQGAKGLVVQEGAINSLVFDDCVFESLDILADIYPENNIRFNDLYVENIPKTHVGFVFNLGISGLKTSNKHSTLTINGGYIQGIEGGVYVKFMNSDWFKTISINNVVFEYFEHLLEFSSNTECVYMTGCFTLGVKYLGTSTNNWNVVTTHGCNFKYTARDHTLQPWIGTNNLVPKRVSTGNPNGVVTPLQIGDEILDTSTNVWYKAHGTTINDWKALN